jgi:hypothetical protein
MYACQLRFGAAPVPSVSGSENVVVAGSYLLTLLRVRACTRWTRSRSASVLPFFLLWFLPSFLLSLHGIIAVRSNEFDADTPPR